MEHYTEYHVNSATSTAIICMIFQSILFFLFCYFNFSRDFFKIYTRAFKYDTIGYGNYFQQIRSLISESRLQFLTMKINFLEKKRKRGNIRTLFFHLYYYRHIWQALWYSLVVTGTKCHNYHLNGS